VKFKVSDGGTKQESEPQAKSPLSGVKFKVSDGGTSKAKDETGDQPDKKAETGSDRSKQLKLTFRASPPPSPEQAAPSAAPAQATAKPTQPTEAAKVQPQAAASAASQPASAPPARAAAAGKSAAQPTPTPQAPPPQKIEPKTSAAPPEQRPASPATTPPPARPAIDPASVQLELEIDTDELDKQRKPSSPAPTTPPSEKTPLEQAPAATVSPTPTSSQSQLPEVELELPPPEPAPGSAEAPSVAAVPGPSLPDADLSLPDADFGLEEELAPAIPEPGQAHVPTTAPEPGETPTEKPERDQVSEKTSDATTQPAPTAGSPASAEAPEAADTTPLSAFEEVDLFSGMSPAQPHAEAAAPTTTLSQAVEEKSAPPAAAEPAPEKPLVMTDEVLSKGKIELSFGDKAPPAQSTAKKPEKAPGRRRGVLLALVGVVVALLLVGGYLQREMLLSLVTSSGSSNDELAFSADEPEAEPAGTQEPGTEETTSGNEPEPADQEDTGSEPEPVTGPAGDAAPVSAPETGSQAATASAGQDEVSGPVTQPLTAVLDIGWQQRGADTQVRVTGNGRIAEDAFSILPLDSPPRLLLRLNGVETGFSKAEISVNSSALLKIRIGHHPENVPPQLFIVLDLNDDAVVVKQQRAQGSTLVITLGH